MKLVEQLTLVTLQTAHHGSTSPRFASTQRNHASRQVSTDFCNKIGTFRTCRLSCPMSAFEGRADLGAGSEVVWFWTHLGHRLPMAECLALRLKSLRPSVSRR